MTDLQAEKKLVLDYFNEAIKQKKLKLIFSF